MKSPFRAIEEVLRIEINVGFEEIEKQTEVLEKYDIYPNGYGWEGVVSQILEKVEPDLLSHLDFDSEGDCFLANADSKESYDRFLEVLNPIFTDIKVFEEYVQELDVESMDF